MATHHVARLSRATIDYREYGEGAPVVFVHGLLLNSNLWRVVAPAVAEAGNRCIAPDWPLGGHSRPVPAADLTPPGVADLIAEFLDELGLRDVTLVANDTGGALVQLLLTRNPERVGRVVFTPSDCFDHFFPPLFAPLPKLARVPGFAWIMATALRSRLVQRSPLGFGSVAKKPVPQEIVDSYLMPSRTSAGVRADLTRFVRTVHKRHTIEAAGKLGAFTKPVLLAWAKDDKVFPVELAHRLAAVLPNATVTEMGDTLTLVPEDQPDELAELIVKFIESE
ncbi:alpha/beta fold hydrolase [Kibdelosporangium phytohabitans]|uniref:Alpha/beta hydrolase n=1 Tax=Kibdelosporangium phytohabitans TaxID=860235 RepID=A0A0N9HW40_9PSEU|nr:alpha/beta hydrolase [Kibdelosporangium phytohabitans]ALG06013.1 alpha/beta hydrolase [Kibdelosporangium phytohabitans]MBE1465917.1 pimeloyl-ACP methyl ester carboxylesterase [Kibdelosporangium phytohabitans]